MRPGLRLHGTEVKSLRSGKCSIKEAFVRDGKRRGLMYMECISAPYEKG